MSILCLSVAYLKTKRMLIALLNFLPQLSLTFSFKLGLFQANLIVKVVFQLLLKALQ